MLFASFDFLLFFAVALTGFWALSRRPLARTVWVVAASYFFYMAGPKPVDGPPPTPWYFVGLLVVSTVVDYVCGLRIARARAASRLPLADATARPEPGRRPGRGWLVVSVVTNLGLLAYFKYTGFLLEVARDLGSLFGSGAGFPVVELLLPVGISFYTFQSLSYTIDVYRGRIPAERSLLSFAMFVAFFPQLVAGPIVRASEFLPQLAKRPRLSRPDVDFAVFRVSRGLIKKVIFGDFIAAYFADIVFASPGEYSSLENLLALYAFTLQIYADFSGYSDIAIGIARLLGFHIPENFNRPYCAVDVGDFWRRWHITLSTWLRDYLYYPLGGSRLGTARTYFNLWVTMFLIGMWHGASWNFVIYSTLQAAAMVFNRFIQQPVTTQAVRVRRVLGAAVLVAFATTMLASVGLQLDQPWLLGLLAGTVALSIGLLPSVERAPRLRPIHVLLTLHFSTLTRVFFRAEDLTLARAMTRKLVEWDGLGVRPGLFDVSQLSTWLRDVPSLAWLLPVSNLGILVLLAMGFLSHYLPQRVTNFAHHRLLSRVPAPLLGVGFAVLLALLDVLLAGPRPNIYFAF